MSKRVLVGAAEKSIANKLHGGASPPGPGGMSSYQKLRAAQLGLASTPLALDPISVERHNQAVERWNKRIEDQSKSPLPCHFVFRSRLACSQRKRAGGDTFGSWSPASPLDCVNVPAVVMLLDCCACASCCCSSAHHPPPPAPPCLMARQGHMRGPPMAACAASSAGMSGRRLQTHSCRNTLCEPHCLADHPPQMA